MSTFLCNPQCIDGFSAKLDGQLDGRRSVWRQVCQTCAQSGPSSAFHTSGTRARPGPGCRSLPMEESAGSPRQLRRRRLPARPRGRCGGTWRVGRLHRVLDRQTRDSRREQADIIRLLLLTGCRRNEILRLRWSEVDRDRLVLADGKTGPRIVPLNTPARRVLERRPCGGSPFVFPSPRDPARPRSRNLAFCARREWVRLDPSIPRRLAPGRGFPPRMPG